VAENLNRSMTFCAGACCGPVRLQNGDRAADHGLAGSARRLDRGRTQRENAEAAATAGLRLPLGAGDASAVAHMDWKVMPATRSKPPSRERLPALRADSSAPGADHCSTFSARLLRDPSQLLRAAEACAGCRISQGAETLGPGSGKLAFRAIWKSCSVFFRLHVRLLRRRRGWNAHAPTSPQRQPGRIQPKDAVKNSSLHRRWNAKA